MGNIIHNTAIIGKNVILGKEVEIGPYCVIEGEVDIGDGTKISAGTKIKGKVKIGKNNQICENAIIGNPPQDIKYKGEDIFIEIGDNNIIKEFVTIHAGPNNGTKISNNNFLMAYVHIAHNCKIGNNVIIANATQLAGFVEVEDFAFISGLCPIHQFVRIGPYSMIGGGYRVNKDVIPYALAAGDPLKIYGLNIVGLKRYNFTTETINILKKAFRLLLSKELNTQQALNHIGSELPQIQEIQYLIDFIKKSKRGIAK